MRYEGTRKTTHETDQDMDISIAYVVFGMTLEVFDVLRRGHLECMAGCRTKTLHGL